jgi:hypothetical protein
VLSAVVVLIAAPTSPSLQTARNRDRNLPGASHWRSPESLGICAEAIWHNRETWILILRIFYLQNANSAVIKVARFARLSVELDAGSDHKG